MRIKITVPVLLLLLFLSAPLFAGGLVKAGPYMGYFAPRNEELTNVYGSGDLNYGLKAGIKIFKGFQVFASITSFYRISETTMLGDITRLTLTPLNLSMRHTFSMGTVNPFLAVGYTYVHFNERSEIGSNKDQGGGYSIDAGVEIDLTPRFILELGARYSEVIVNPTGFDVDLGGLQAGISFLVNI